MPNAGPSLQCHDGKVCSWSKIIRMSKIHQIIFPQSKGMYCEIV